MQDWRWDTRATLLRETRTANTRTECRNSKECQPAKHHYDECVERVTAADDKSGNGEDCIEECE